jgi:thiamine pyrophosphokinase
MADNPTIQNHSNFFWEDPAQFRKQVPRLAVLLVNSTHCLWKIKKKIDSTTRNHPNELFWNCWSNAHVTICADGGANRLYDRAIKVDAEDLVIPQYIKGDLDSIRDDVKEFYRKKGTQILHDVDQNTNDLDKCLQLLADLQRNIGSSVNNDCHDKFTVMIFGAMGGRFDQEIQNINALFRWSNIFQDIILLSEETTAVLLLPGKHMIYPNFQYETRTCGLVPISK